MPMHDWTRVPAGIFHAFHLTWVAGIVRGLSAALPPDYYALPERAAGSGPDVPTPPHEPPHGDRASESEDEFILRKKSVVAVRHVSGDRIVAMIEIVSPGNKDSAHGFKAFIDKAAELLGRGVHLLLVDPFPPGPRDPGGVHAAVAAALGDVNAYRLTAPAPIAVGSAVPDMPVFLEPDVYIDVPLAAAYDAACTIFPRRWRDVVTG